ncbi:hypothetical protein FPZ54_05745 [Sphingomonas suaedae]|uniref:SpoVT-AbrB domain-containing protein n=1 Tax=Sphingomonas suaedae TaxID=2599297 RepID=A0A518RDM5_9SPHN|nr:AbrB/MazE/SpoVT family DNA-binding domain-containing protein [Sphingomonas suaedae]QDX25570.1 hypothetical protein FPZ54_05745 [Sphingomonas suaedae]
MNAPIDLRTVTNMTSKGQVLIPKDVRDRLGLQPGKPVQVGINDRGEAVVLPAPSEPTETPDERRARLMKVLAEVRARQSTGKATDEIMEFLRGDEPLP